VPDVRWKLLLIVCISVHQGFYNEQISEKQRVLSGVSSLLVQRLMEPMFTDLPGRELLHNKFVRNISLLIGHNEYASSLSDILIGNREEGLVFIDPRLMIASERDTRMKLRSNLPIDSLSTLQKIRTLCPSPDESDSEFSNQFDRINQLISG
jgi:hypothetical protein